MADANSRTCTVYGLFSEADGAIRYIGQTKRQLRNRLCAHISGAVAGGRTRRDAWIRSVIKAGGSIEVIAIDESAIWNETEIRLIQEYRAAGFKLVNSTSGGDGVRDLPDHVRARLSDAAKRRVYSLSYRKERSLRAKAIGISPAHRAKMADGVRKAYRERGAEISSRLSASRTGKTIPHSTRRKISEALIGRSRPQEVRDLLSKLATERMQSIEAREKISAATREAMARPDVRAKLISALAKRYADAGYRAKLSEANRKRLENPKARADLSRAKAKLSDEQVLEARSLRKAGLSLKDLCAMFGLSMGPMSMLCNGKTFKHVPM